MTYRAHQAPSGGRPSRQNAALIAAAIVNVALTALAVVVIMMSDQPGDRPLIALGFALVIAVPVAVGLWAWSEHGRFGRLLVAAGFLFFFVALSNSSNELVYSVGRVAVWLVEPVVAIVLLAFPTGELRTRLDRRLAGTFFALVALLYLPTALMVERYPTPVPYASCTDGCPQNAFMLLGHEPDFVAQFVYPLRDLAAAALFLVVVVVLARRLRLATPLMRRTLGPVVGVAIVRGLLFAGYVLLRRASPTAGALDVLGWLYLLCTPAVGVALLIGLLRRRLFEAAALQHLALRLREHPDAAEVRGVLAEVVGDPSLQLVYWAGGPRRWVDAKGRSVELPRETSLRSVTQVQDGDHPVAALVYDSALRDQEDFVLAAGSFAVAALENQRLAAKVDASFGELQDSRARIQAAADSERQRIERDLHDGAQQRLVALRIRLELAGDLMGEEPERGKRILGELGGELDEALEEVQSLARGIYPSLLAEQGLEEALRSIARRVPTATIVEAPGLGRYAMEVEAVVYFCCLEALQNAAKHATGATAVSISVVDDGALTFTVRDDGPGFASGTVKPGAGLTNMRDRLAAVGGELTIDSKPGDGTRVVGRIPLGSAAG